ncbi:sensor histidine kinase [Micromonospora sp. NBC_01796]|uniref:sensor histidine kinase n=1 Tax=Micromonospora sp. NBC_01796 TaxID=2975987 RepID=UPI002DDC1894|nr:sensor histidine kinase [Micromonospora sp. NBC_01796]WSA85153.1 sensor histidine kinase [Micromonospora sp. NBC_01796]
MTPSGQRPPPRSAPGLALLTALVQAAGTATLVRGQQADVGVVGYTLLVLGGLALADRHRFPRRNFVIVAVATTVYLVLDHPPHLAFVAPAIAVSAAITAGHRWLVWSVAFGGYAVWLGSGAATIDRALTGAAIVVGLGLFTELVTPAVRLVQQAAREQWRLNEERQRRQASEERLRIAAELHDVLGHHLSLINIRAGVALHLMAREPDQARVALDTIQRTSAEALREVQSVLNTLYPTGGAAPRSPAPGLDRLAHLTVDAGLPVRTVVGGEPRPLPAGVDRAAYRVVQEALTNVRRHAGTGAVATITIEYRPEALMVQIDDDGGAGEPRDAPAGNGITGMRERAAALGGVLTAGPVPGGWRVHAHLPLDPEPAP